MGFEKATEKDQKSCTVSTNDLAQEGIVEDVVSGECCAGETFVELDAEVENGACQANDAIPLVFGEQLPEGSCLPIVKHGTFGGRQGFELESAGPFMHSFVF